MRLPCYSDTMVPQNALNYSPLRSLRVDGWKYILSPRSELYHVAEDGKEVFDLVQIEADRAARMKDEVREIIVQSPEPIAGRGEVRALDEDESRKLAALGYLGSNHEYVDRSANELDHFELVGISPRDRMEVVECWASGLGAFHAGQFEIAEKAYRRFLGRFRGRGRAQRCSARAETLARAGVKSKNELDHRSSFGSTSSRIGRSGARRYGRAVSVARTNLTALRANDR